MTEDTFSRTPLIIIGAGPAARIAQDIALSLEVLVYGFLTEDEALVNQQFNDLPVIAALGSTDADTLLGDEHAKVVLAEPDNDTRRAMVLQMDEMKGEFISLIHASAVLSPYARQGRGNLISAHTVIQSNAMVGSFNHIGAGVRIGVDAEIGDYCTIQDGAVIGQGAAIEEEAFIGANAVIYPGVRIGAGALVGPGSVVLRDVGERISVFGNPAKQMKGSAE
ncbi:MAG: NeuD/PglB/VioB family sugar acetyltransferase [Bacteroidia bacterium]|nr:NeuD/PglB/VioB family sugar acetyltransferase [Bacteroidia bacterium]